MDCRVKPGNDQGENDVSPGDEDGTDVAGSGGIVGVVRPVRRRAWRIPGPWWRRVCRPRWRGDTRRRTGRATPTIPPLPATSVPSSSPGETSFSPWSLPAHDGV